MRQHRFILKPASIAAIDPIIPDTHLQAGLSKKIANRYLKTKPAFFLVPGPP